MIPTDTASEDAEAEPDPDPDRVRYGKWVFVPDEETSQVLDEAGVKQTLPVTEA